MAYLAVFRLATLRMRALGLHFFTCVALGAFSTHSAWPVLPHADHAPASWLWLLVLGWAAFALHASNLFRGFVRRAFRANCTVDFNYEPAFVRRVFRSAVSVGVIPLGAAAGAVASGWCCSRVFLSPEQQHSWLLPFLDSGGLLALAWAAHELVGVAFMPVLVEGFNATNEQEGVQLAGWIREGKRANGL